MARTLPARAVTCLACLAGGTVVLFGVYRPTHVECDCCGLRIARSAAVQPADETGGPLRNERPLASRRRGPRRPATRARSRRRRSSLSSPRFSNTKPVGHASGAIAGRRCTAPPNLAACDAMFQPLRLTPAPARRASCRRSPAFAPRTPSFPCRSPQQSQRRDARAANEPSGDWCHREKFRGMRFRIASTAKDAGKTRTACAREFGCMGSLLKGRCRGLLATRMPSPSC